MIQLEKFRKVMNQVAAEKGDFLLFGFFLSEEPQDKLDLVISSPWLEKGKLKALSEFVEKMSSIVGQKDVLALSKIVTLNHDDPHLQAILKTVQVENGLVVLQDTNLFGLEVKQAYILQAKKLKDPAQHVA
ncbi:MAG: hypothetical protein AB1757_06295 [Acidobacteriota bacterium]